MPRGQWKAPGIRPSRSSSRTSRRSTNTTFSLPRRCLASSRLMVLMRDLASSTICLNPLRGVFMAMIWCLALPCSDFEVFLPHRRVGREGRGGPFEHDTPVAHHVHPVSYTHLRAHETPEHLV